jgi:hypothetical protein
MVVGQAVGAQAANSGRVYRRRNRSGPAVTKNQQLKQTRNKLPGAGYAPGGTYM